MAGKDGQAHELVEFLRGIEQEPYRYDLFQLLRRVEAICDAYPRLGDAKRLADDPIRLAQIPHLIFAPASISKVEPQRKKPRLTTYCFGLFGPQGPLPLHLTSYARDRLRNHDDWTLTRFGDIFHHRLLCFFYRAWADAQPTVSLDRPQQDTFSQYLASLIGRGMPTLRNRDALPDLVKLHFAGRLANQRRNAEDLEAMLAGYLGLPVRVEQFVAHWLRLPPESRLRLGESTESGSLGVSTVIGARVPDRQHKFRIVLGPLTFAEYRRMLPGSASLTRLVDLVRNFLGDELQWDVNLILKRDDLPPPRLGVSSRLGWDTWLAKQPPANDPADLCLDPFFQSA